MPPSTMAVAQRESDFETTSSYHLAVIGAGCWSTFLAKPEPIITEPSLSVITHDFQLLSIIHHQLTVTIDTHIKIQ